MRYLLSIFLILACFITAVDAGKHKGKDGKGKRKGKGTAVVLFETEAEEMRRKRREEKELRRSFRRYFEGWQAHYREKGMLK